MATVAETRKRKKDLKASDPEEFARQMEAQKIAEKEAPDPVTQSVLDEARSQGINVFRGVNLARLSREGQVKEQERANIRGTTVESIQELEGAREESLNKPLAEAELLKRARQSEEGFADIASIGRERKAQKKEERGILAGLSQTDNLIIAFGEIGEKLNRLTWMGLNEASGHPFVDVASFDSIINDQEQVVSNIREGLTRLASEVKAGDRDPDNALRALAEMEDTIISAERQAHQAGRYSAKAYAEGLDTLEARLIRSKNDLETARFAILRAQARAQVTEVTQEDIVGGLT